MFMMKKPTRLQKRKPLNQVMKFSMSEQTTKKYAYLKAADGTLVRVEVVLDKESWKYTINVSDAEGIFDGLFFAG